MTHGKTKARIFSGALKLEADAKAIIVVAHPDDEVIWAGGAIMGNRQADWTIFSLCRASDHDREPKFQRVAHYLGAHGIITDLDDAGQLSDEQAVDEAKRLIRNEIGGQEFDFLFTHGDNGEYGHRGHKQVNRAIRELVEAGELKVKNLLFFDYEKVNRKILPMIPAAKPDFILELKPKSYEEKRRIVAEMYGYPYEGIDVNLCTNIEAFKSYR